MKININKDEIISAINWNIAREIIEYYVDYGDRRKEVIELLSFTDVELIEMISEAALNQHIAENVHHYKATSKLVDEIDKLKEELEKFKNKEVILFTDKNNVKRFFCDLLDLNYHADKRMIINKIKELL
ncbi:MAG: hypothetical protein GXO49_02685 [Chlorobi bacterium]|nr:hypothetical protein [Chlorobiota bacterium]